MRSSEKFQMFIHDALTAAQKFKKDEGFLDEAHLADIIDQCDDRKLLFVDYKMAVEYIKVILKYRKVLA